MRNFIAVSVLLLGVFSFGCSHSTDPQSSGGSGNGTPWVTGPYGVGGNVDEINAGPSSFDTVYFVGAGAATIHLTGPKDTTAGTFGGLYAFNHLPAGNYAMTISVGGFPSSTVYFSEPRDSGVEHYTRLFPESWIKSTIDLVSPDVDPTNGLHVKTHLETMDLSRPAVGTVYLYLSKTNAIDPKKPETYDWICNYEPGYQKDSLVTVTILPQEVRKYYPKGTTVYCKAYASPYNQQYNYPSYDSTGKLFYPYFGKYPTNAVPITIP